jgi:hypothetical protein
VRSGGRALGAAYPDVLRQAKAEAKKLTTATRAPLEKLHAIMAEIGPLLADVKSCRAARNDPSEFRHYNDTKLTVEGLNLRCRSFIIPDRARVTGSGLHVSELGSGDHTSWDEVWSMINDDVNDPGG